MSTTPSPMPLRPARIRAASVACARTSCSSRRSPVVGLLGPTARLPDGAREQRDRDDQHRDDEPEHFRHRRPLGRGEPTDGLDPILFLLSSYLAASAKR